MKTKIGYFFILSVFGLFSLYSCRQKPPNFYNSADFEKVSKIDVHFHYNTSETKILEFVHSIKMSLVSPNVDAGLSIEKQLNTSSSVQENYLDRFAFLGTFSVQNFGKPGFAEQIIARIDSCMDAGAAGIKIWKNIGMVLKDSLGKYVMADDPAFTPVFNYLEEKNIPLMGHLGEPRNCWLPEEKMTLDNDKRYFREHPQYHMYLHPEAPTYNDQINSRDNLLKKHPNINFIGAHLGSLEWNVDELAIRLEKYPNFNVDFSARIGHLQNQSSENYEKIRDFMIKYQDRLLYGTDYSVSEKDTNILSVTKSLHRRWKEQWLFLATDTSTVIKDLGGRQVKGLHLPREVIDKIYFDNANRLLGLKFTNEKVDP